jgi:hypothetical protein
MTFQPLNIKITLLLLAICLDSNPRVALLLVRGSSALVSVPQSELWCDESVNVIGKIQ